MTIDSRLSGVERVVAQALGYRTSALERPELYGVMFERPFREHVPSPKSRSVALAVDHVR